MKNNAKNIRLNILRLANKAKNIGAHIAPSLSIVEILSVLFCDVMNHKKDKFILSKGHAALAYYCAMKEASIISNEELNKFEDNGGEYPGQPTKTFTNKIDFASGSLGLGLSYAIGLAYSLKISKCDGNVYVLVGNGELNEGSNWESLMFIKHHNLNNIIIVIDDNEMQSDGFTNDILKFDIESGIKGFGFEVLLCDGHNEFEFKNCLEKQTDSCKVIIAKTIKGKGVSFMEGNNEWHHAKLDDSKYNEAINEIKNG